VIRKAFSLFAGSSNDDDRNLRHYLSHSEDGRPLTDHSNDGDRETFYAALYLGLYREAIGQAQA